MIRVRPAAPGPPGGTLRGAALAALLALPGPPPGIPTDFVHQVIAAAVAQTARPTRYDGSYRRIGYPAATCLPTSGSVPTW